MGQAQTEVITMPCRQGMGKGTGSGYRNLIGKDPMVHSMSAKGMKQPQNVPYAAQVEMSPRGIGKAHTATVPKLKLEQIGGDVNWKDYNGQFIVDEKFNNGEFDYYVIINFTNMKEAVGDDAPSKYMVTVHVVAPSQASKKQIDSAFESMGLDPKQELKIRKDPKAVAGILDEYGLMAEVFTEEGDNADELMDTAKKQVPAITGLFGFYMDKPVNRIGNSGWDAIKGDIGFKSEKMEHKVGGLGDKLQLIGHTPNYDVYEDKEGNLYHYTGSKEEHWSNPAYWEKLESNFWKRLKAKGLPHKEIVKGGLGDNRPDSDFDAKELKKGMKVEMEHTKDPKVAKEIVKDHLTEFPKGYYEGLYKLEKKLKKQNKIPLSTLKNYEKPHGYKYYNWFFTPKGEYVVYSRDGKRYYIDRTKNSNVAAPNMPFLSINQAKEWLRKGDSQ
jgi:hypothetical protein